MDVRICKYLSGIALLVLSAMVAAPTVAAQERVDRFWSEEVANEAAADAEGEEERPWMITSPFANVSWPELKLPTIDFRPPWRRGDAADDEEEGWAEGPFQRVRQATRDAVARTRTRWNNAIDRMKLTHDEEDSATQLADAEAKPSLWQRWFGSEEPAEGPSSVGDMMAKEADGTGGTVRR